MTREQFTINTLPMIVLACTIVSFFNNAMCETTSNSAKDKSILVSSGNPQAEFGSKVVVSVSYKNQGKRKWILPIPDQKLGVTLWYQRIGGDGYRNGVSMTKPQLVKSQLPNGQWMTAKMLPMVKNIEILPSKEYVFRAPLNRDCLGDLTLGKWKVWIEDQAEKLKSNVIEVEFVFTGISLKQCLAIAKNEKEYIVKRKFYYRWLEKFDPSTKLDFGNASKTNHTPAKMEPAIQKRLAEFEAFINDPKNAEHVKKVIAQINKEAGVKPVTVDPKKGEGPKTTGDNKTKKMEKTNELKAKDAPKKSSSSTPAVRKESE